MTDRLTEAASAGPWLRRLVEERVSRELELTMRADSFDLRCRGAPARRITMPAWQWGLGTAVRAHTWFDPRADGYDSTVGGAIPAPGTDALPVRVIERTPAGIAIRYDILGLARWALSRAEEVGRADLDEHGRFPADSSHAHRNGYLDRPVVDEWMAMLRQAAVRLWPGMPLTASKFRLRLSHDVDRPSEYALCAPQRMLAGAAGDLLRRRDQRAARRRLRIWLGSRRRLHCMDPYNTFDWLMSVAERRGVQGAFYFVCARTDPARDPSYRVAHPAIRDLLRRIHGRGHEIGLHVSYGGCRSAELIGNEAARLRDICSRERIEQPALGARMHYLRLRIPDTLRHLAGAGIAYDATLGYADAAGFRCGTCLDYAAVDPHGGEQLNLTVRPLIAMDVSLIASRYMGLGVGAEALEYLVELKNRCRAVRGAFNLLWHNNAVVDPAERALYEAVADA